MSQGLADRTSAARASAASERMSQGLADRTSAAGLGRERAQRRRPAVPALPIRVAAGTAAIDALREAGVELERADGAVVVRDPDGVLKDLDWAPDSDTDVEAVPASSPDGLAVLRHSAAHVMAQAVQDLFPGTLLGIGPPIEDGFYYDFLPVPAVHPGRSRRDREEDGRDRQGRPALLAAGRSTTTTARDELAHEKFKLELIGLKSAPPTERARRPRSAPAA